MLGCKEPLLFCFLVQRRLARKSALHKTWHYLAEGGDSTLWGLGMVAQPGLEWPLWGRGEERRSDV